MARRRWANAAWVHFGCVSIAVRVHFGCVSIAVRVHFGCVSIAVRPIVELKAVVPLSKTAPTFSRLLVTLGTTSPE